MIANAFGLVDGLGKRCVCRPAGRLAGLMDFARVEWSNSRTR
jgi:hypothetical protein